MCKILEIYVMKFLNYWAIFLNPVFLKEFFYSKESNGPVREKYKLDLQIPKINQVSFSTKSIRELGPKV